MTKYQQGFPVNENGEIVVSGTNQSVVGVLPIDMLPVDDSGGLKLGNVATLATDAAGNAIGLGGLTLKAMGVPISRRALDGFSSTANWSSASAGVPSLTTSVDAAAGNTMMLTTDGTTNNHDVSRTVVADLTSGDAISARIKMSSGINYLNITLSLADTTFSKTATIYDLAVPGAGGGGIADFFSDTWRTISFNANNVMAYSGGATFSDLAKVRAIRIRTRATAGAATLNIAQFFAQKDKYGPRVIFVFDDGRLNQYANAYPILNKYGYVGTLACMPASWGTVYSGGNNQPIMSATQAAEMYSSGWEFVGHAETSFNGKSASQVQADIDSFLNWSIANGYKRGRSHWVYVGGWFNTTTANIINNQFVSARRIGGIANGFQTPDVFEPSQISTYYNTTGYSVATYKAKLDQLATSKSGLLIITFHNVVPSLTAEPEDITTSDFEQVIAYAASLGIKSTTFDAEFGSIW